MTTTQTPDNTVLALYPPRAPEATTPINGAHYGVPKHVYDLKPMGLTIVVDPPPDGTVNAGDVIRLILNNASIEATKTIQPGEENAQHTLYLPKGLLLPDRDNTLVYSIARGSQNIGRSTPELTLRYNAIRPGNEDLTPGDGAHSELRLILPQDVIDDGIDAERAKQGVQVCFAYPYCRAYDVIRLNCNGQDVVRTVTATEAPATPSAEPTTICVMVGEDVFQRAGDNTKFVFSYTVLDQLLNGPDTDSPYSGRVEIDVHLKEIRLVAPDMAEDPDDPSDDPSTIDLAKLGSKDLTVLVHAFAPRWQPNDKIRVTYTATKPGAPVVSHTVEADVGRIPFTYKLMVPNAKVIAGSVARAKYELIRGGDIIATSNTAKATVTDAAPIDLKPEITSVTDSLSKEIPHNGGTVDPQVKLTGTATPRQQVEIFEASASKGEWPVNAEGQWTYETTLSGIGTRTFTAKADYGTGQVSAGRTFTLSNVLTPAIDSVQDSAGVEIPDKGSTSDTAIKLTGTATPRLEVEIYDGAVPIGKAQVSGNTGQWELDVTGLTLTTHSFKAKALYGAGAESAVRTLTVIEATAPTLTSVKGSPSGVEIPDAGFTLETAVTLSGVAARGQNVEVFDGATSKGPATADGTTSIWTLLVPGLNVAAHSFTAKALYGSGAVSQARNLTVAAELDVDTTPITFSGTVISLAGSGLPWTSTATPDHAVAHRIASGGTLPYTYSSSKPQVASVDQAGEIRGLSTGETIITVADSRGQQKKITVSSSIQPVVMRRSSSLIYAKNYPQWVATSGGVGATPEIAIALNAHKFITSVLPPNDLYLLGSPRGQSTPLRVHIALARTQRQPGNPNQVTARYDETIYIGPPDYPQDQSIAICFIL